MNTPASSTVSSRDKRRNFWTGFALSVVALALVMMRAPVPLDVEPHLAYQSLLYETLRLGHTWGEALITTDGPLAAVQSPVYASGSIWMAMIWQIGGNLFLALILIGAAYQLPGKSRWWALGLLFATLARVPVVAPWIGLVLLGWYLIRSREPNPLFAMMAAGALGFLGLSSLGHLLLGCWALGLALVTLRPPRVKLAMAAGVVVGVLGGWLVLGQPIRGLWLWVGRAFPALWQTSSLVRNPAFTASLGFWVALCGAAFAVVLVFFQYRIQRRDFWVSGIFIAGAGLLAWKTVALQPFGLPEVFFGTVIVAAFLLFHSDQKTVVPVILAILAFAGLVRWQRLILVDGIGHFNRQLVLNIRMLAGLPSLRPSLHEQVKQVSVAHQLPRVKAVVGQAGVDLIGGSPSEMILGKLSLHSRPAPIDALVRTPRIATLNQQAMDEPNAPEFILQRLQPSNDLATALNDATAQLELYRRYEFVLEEEGGLLWKRKASRSELAAPVLIGAGTLALGETLPLPPAPAGSGYWLELDIRPSFIGHLWTILDELSQPGLVVRDNAEHELHYVIPAAMAGRGFLVAPFLRGEPDLLRLKSGGDLPQISSVTVIPPANNRALWNKRVNYRLYTVPGFKLASHDLSSAAFENFRLFNRVPIATAFFLPIKVLPYESGVFIAFAHPSSSIEFAVTPRDHRVHASFGILHTAYEKGNSSDGVDFSVEFVAADGIRQILYHRYLDPLSVPEDRGLQQLNVELPAGRSGRLILRTYNPPERNQVYDWSYWGGITIE